jgi:hypothetical protein
MSMPMSMSDFEMKENKDIQTIMDAIGKYENAEDVYSGFKKGPDPKHGFMFTLDDWWDPKQLVAMKFVSNLVLDLGWDSSGYGFMMRKIEYEINKRKKS